MNGGIRPGIWLAAGAALAAAVAILWLATPIVGGEPRQPTRAASPDRSPAPKAESAVGVHPAAALLPHLSSPPAPSSPNSRQAAPSRVAVATAPAAAARLHPVDSRAAADLRILQEEASRRAEALGLSPLSGGPDLDGDDAGRGGLANAYLVDSLVQEAFRSNGYPLGYPADERERALAESLVRGADPQALQDLLQRALAQEASERAAPQVTGELWEGAGN
jgi:hypothetical protein